MDLTNPSKCHYKKAYQLKLNLEDLPDTDKKGLPAASTSPAHGSRAASPNSLLLNAGQPLADGVFRQLGDAAQF